MLLNKLAYRNAGHNAIGFFSLTFIIEFYKKCLQRIKEKKLKNYIFSE